MMKREKNDRNGERVSPFLLNKFQGKLFYIICVVIFGCSAIGLIGHGMFWLQQNVSAKNTQKELQNLKEKTADTPQATLQYDRNGFPIAGIAVFFDNLYQKEFVEAVEPKQAEILQKYQELYEMNQDMAGWLTIDGTVIDYPVMQTMEDEDYYLDIDFYGQPNQNGCLIMDTDSRVGTGTVAWDYTDGEAPSTNLIIHGHTMKSGEMFGNLMKYEDETYGKEHRIIKFDSLYEEREYELIAVFYSQVFYKSDQVFKYYKFFQADTQEEFDDWYSNIKEMSLYDTGVTAELGDEFITLSCCSYHVEDGRFVVVGKRIK